MNTKQKAISAVIVFILLIFQLACNLTGDGGEVNATLTSAAGEFYTQLTAIATKTARP